MPNKIDRNASSNDRIRRVIQRLSIGAATSTIKVSAPITNGKNGLGLAISTGSGLEIVNNELAIGQISESQVTNLIADLAARMFASTTLSTVAPLFGGGLLSTDLTLFMTEAGPSTSGWLSSTDFNRIGGSTSTGGGTVVSVGLAGLPSTIFTITGSPVTSSGTLTFTMTEAGTSTSGWLSSTDWNTFNLKLASSTSTLFLPSSTSLNYLPLSTVLNTTGPITGGGALSTGLTIGITQVSSTTNGYLSSTDWTVFSQRPVLKNRLINGNFDFWQWGTSVNSGGYSADRWNTQNGSTGSAQVRQYVMSAGELGGNVAAIYGLTWAQPNPQPQIPLRGYSSGASTTVTGNFTVAFASGTLSTDVVILGLSLSAAVSVLLAPSGWTFIGSTQGNNGSGGFCTNYAVWAYGSTTNLTFTHTGSNDLGWVAASFYNISTGVIDATGTPSNSANTATLTANSVTVVNNGAIEVISAQAENGPNANWTATGFTSLQNAGASVQPAAILYSGGLSPGATGTITLTNAVGAAGQILTAVPFTLAPAAAMTPAAPVLEQRIESVTTLAGQPAALSFWAKSSTAITVSTQLVQYFGSGGSPSATRSTAFFNVTLSSTWTKYSGTITVPSIVGSTLGTADGSYLSVQFLMPSSSTFTVTFAQVQFEPGSMATDFEWRPSGMEFALCQRYYERSYDLSQSTGTAQTGPVIAPNTVNTVAANTAGTASTGTFLGFKAEKRATPTVVLYSGAGASGGTHIWRATGPVNADRGGATVASVTRTGLILGVTYDNTGATAVGTNSAISAHWTANAEL